MFWKAHNVLGLCAGSYCDVPSQQAAAAGMQLPSRMQPVLLMCKPHV